MALLPSGVLPPRWQPPLFPRSSDLGDGLQCTLAESCPALSAGL